MPTDLRPDRSDAGLERLNAPVDLHADHAVEYPLGADVGAGEHGGAEQPFIAEGGTSRHMSAGETR